MRSMMMVEETVHRRLYFGTKRLVCASRDRVEPLKPESALTGKTCIAGCLGNVDFHCEREN